jgi:hypothetical protein
MADHPITNMIAWTCMIVVGLAIKMERYDMRQRQSKPAPEPPDDTELEPTKSHLAAERAISSARKATPDAMPPPLFTAKAVSDMMLYPKAPLQPVVQSDLLILNAPDPARVALRLQKRGNDWLWRIHNKELREIGPCRLMIRHQRSFDTELGQYREPTSFSCNLGNVQRLAAGDMSDQHYFTRLNGTELEIGDSTLTRLPWPNGDESEIQQWMLELDFSGLTSLPSYAIWNIDIVIKWNTKDLTLTFVKFSSGLTAAS